MKVSPINIVNPNRTTDSRKQAQTCNANEINFAKTKKSFVVWDVTKEVFPSYTNVSSKLDDLMGRVSVNVNHTKNCIKAEINGESYAKNDTYDPFQIQLEKNNSVENKLNCTVGWSMGESTPPLAVIDTQEYTIFLLPGSSAESETVKASNKVGFKGMHIYTHYKPEKTIKTIKQTFPQFLERYASKEDIKEHFNNLGNYDEVEIHQPGGGNGERIKQPCEVNHDNKSSFPLAARFARLANSMEYTGWKAGFIKEDKLDEIEVHHFERNLGPVVCILASHGYKINPETLLLEKDKESKPFDVNKFHVVYPVDNLTDMDLAKVWNDCKSKKDEVGMMVVGVPDERAYGGLIVADENNVIKEFVSKEDPRYKDTGDKEAYLENWLGMDLKTGEEKENIKISMEQATKNRATLEEFGKMESPRGEYLYRGNAFVYFINPEIIPTIVSICNSKILNARDKYMKEHNYTSVNSIGLDEQDKIIECLWDREIIPTLVEKSNAGELLNFDKKELKVYTHNAKCDWSDVGQFEQFFYKNIELASKDKFKNLPKKLKEAMRKNIKITSNGAKVVVFNGGGKELNEVIHKYKIGPGSRIPIVVKDQNLD